MAKLSDEEVQRIISRLFTGNPITRKEAEVILVLLGRNFVEAKAKARTADGCCQMAKRLHFREKPVRI